MMTSFYTCPDCGAMAQEYVPHVCKNGETSTNYQKAKAILDSTLRLNAVAPELLELCQEASDELMNYARYEQGGRNHGVVDLIQRLDAAIAKAKPPI